MRRAYPSGFARAGADGLRRQTHARWRRLPGTLGSVNESFRIAAGDDIARRANDRWRQVALLALCTATGEPENARTSLAGVLHSLDAPDAVRQIVSPSDDDPWARWWSVLAAGQTGRLGHLRSAIAQARAAEVQSADDREVARRLGDLDAELEALGGSETVDAKAARFAMLGHRARPERRVLLAGRSSATFILDPGWDMLRLLRLGPSDGPASGNGAHHSLGEILVFVRRGDPGPGRTVPDDDAPSPDPHAFLAALKEGSGDRDQRLLELAAEVRDERRELTIERARLVREREAFEFERANARRIRATSTATPTPRKVEVPTTPQAAAALLGVAAGSRTEEIDRAYRALVAGAHPDRVADLDPRIRASAEELTVALNGARDLLLGRSRPARRRP